MTKGIDTRAIEKATGKSWTEWVKFLDGVGARDMTHPEIAKAAYDKIVESGVFDDAEANAKGRQNSSGWWSQSVTVAYEQHIGRRAPGQRSDGTYEVSVTKTIEGSRDDAMDWWLGKVAGKAEFDGAKLKAEPTTTSSAYARNWRVTLEDGTKVLASAADKAGGKALLAVTSQKLKSAKDAETWRSYWKTFLAN